MKLNRNQNVLLVILLILILVETGMAGIDLSISQSYTTGYQGAKARFAGVQHSGKKHTNPLWGSTLSWDVDGRGDGKPALAGEMTSVFVPRESVGNQPSWIPSDWLLSSTTIKNPVNEYEWELAVDGNKTALYRMEEWSLKWYFSISSEATYDEIPFFQPIPNPAELVKRNRLDDVKVWFRFDLTPTWYFEGSTNAYFAIAELRLSDIALGGVLHKRGGATEKDVKVNKDCRVIPSSANSILTLYYGLFGTEIDRAEKNPVTYQGKRLNPDLFTDEVYSYFTLDNFGVTAWWDLGRWWRGDTVTVAVDVHVFVIGEWIVQDVQDIPDDYGRTAKTGGAGLGLGAFFGSPTGRLVMLAILAVIALLFFAVFAPSFLLGLFVVFGGSKRRR